MKGPAGRTLFIANRGEIAVRINRAGKALGMTVVQGHSAADADSLAVRMADRAVLLGPPPAAQSYLNIPAVVAAAKASGADAVHPGYGFLSENAGFAAAVEAAGMIFVGPRPETIAMMGDKAAALAAARDAGVPTVPGSGGRVDPNDAAAVAAGIGYPVMIKAAAGGGGRGIRVARDAAELARLAPQAAAEAEAAFGDGGLYLERMIEHARHVEVQVLGDGVRAIHLGERECSLQRRRQKVWEEAPAPGLSPATRARIGAVSVALAERVGYRGAGTLEYLYDAGADAFHFIEMNTRIQVEHPVTEAVTGVDLVQAMIRIAFGGPLPDPAPARGWAIEVRINAEDPARGFLPSPGTITGLHVPPDVRFDTMLYPGYTVPPWYDSLVGKLIVQGDDRAQALARLRAALDGLRVEGVRTTIPLHRALVRDPDVVAGAVDTRFLEAWLAAGPNLEPYLEPPA